MLETGNSIDERLGRGTAISTSDRGSSFESLDAGRALKVDLVSTPSHLPVEPVAAGQVSTPLSFSEKLMPRVWGGRQLCELLNRELSSADPYGESWDLGQLPEHVSRVADGPHAGRALSELWDKHRSDFVGSGGTSESDFPLLIKWLECRDWLSVQVHPDDRMARENLGEPRGKTEAWIVLQAAPDARIMAGLRLGVTRDALLQHLNAGTLEECLHVFTPRAGDCVVLPAGTIHAAGGGIVFAEVQQSSNATFRMHDWNRSGLDGRPRELQIDLALEAIDWNQGPIKPVRPEPIECLDAGVRGEKLADLPEFRLERYTITRSWPAAHSGELTIWMTLEADAILTHLQTGEVRKVSRGRTILIPAAAGPITWSPINERDALILLCVRLPGDNQDCNSTSG